MHCLYSLPVDIGEGCCRSTYYWQVGKMILKGAAVFCAVFLAGLLYMEWGSFEYNVSDGPQPVLLNDDGRPIR